MAGLVALLAFAVDLLAVDGRTQRPGPPLTLDPLRAHVSVFPGNRAPEIRLYAASDLSGDPPIRLDHRGLWVEGTLACSWPGGQYDPARRANMVLGYGLRAGDLTDYRGCPPGLPIVSTWGDRGVGTAALFIVVADRQGAIVAVPYGSRRLYLDLNALPGDPREPTNDLRRVVRLKGFVGWEWLPPER
jgi:hypothetical protein